MAIKMKLIVQNIRCAAYIIGINKFVGSFQLGFLVRTDYVGEKRISPLQKIDSIPRMLIVNWEKPTASLKEVFAGIVMPTSVGIMQAVKNLQDEEARNI